MNDSKQKNFENCVRENILNPKVSIMVPIYNAEEYIDKCLSSFVSQTLKNIEIICVNDGSTDSTLKILEEYAAKDNRIIIINEENQGQGIARNNAIKIAKGEYLLFVDADDFIEQNTIEILYNEFYRTNVDLIQFDYKTYRVNGKFRGLESYSKKMRKYFNYKIKNNDIYNWHNIKKKNLHEMSLCVWDKAYKTDFIKKNNIEFALNKNGEDHIFSIKANLLANKILYLDKAFYHYRTRLGSAVNKASNDNFCVFDNIKLLKNFLINNNLLNEYEISFNEYTIAVLGWHYANIPFESIDKYLNKCKNILNPKDYKKFLRNIKGKFSIPEKLFSLKNHKENGIKRKYLTILGIKFCLNPKKERGI